MGCIYQICNDVNGKLYIGKTIKTFKYRQSIHLSHFKKEQNTSYLYRAMRKYGFSSFSWKVLSESDEDSVLIELEKKYIKELNTKAPNGYNLTDGGDGTAGFLLSEEHKAKISKSLMGHPVSKETIEKSKTTRQQNHPKPQEKEKPKTEYPRKLSDETKKKISESMKGKNTWASNYKKSDETKKKISSSLIGKNMREGRGPITIGERFGRWVILEKFDDGKKYSYKWKCRCDCGTERPVRQQSILDEESTSCGCYWEEMMKEYSKNRERDNGKFKKNH